MTKDRFYRQGGEKRDLPSYLYPTMHYAIPFLLYTLFNTTNPFTTPCRESLESLANHDFLAPKPQFARIKDVAQSLITRNPKAFFKGKPEWGLSNSGESKVLPRYMQNRFDRYKGFLHQDSDRGIDLQEDALEIMFVVESIFSTSVSIRAERR